MEVFSKSDLQNIQDDNKAQNPMIKTESLNGIHDIESAQVYYVYKIYHDAPLLNHPQSSEILKYAYEIGGARLVSTLISYKGYVSDDAEEVKDIIKDLFAETAAIKDKPIFDSLENPIRLYWQMHPDRDQVGMMKWQLLLVPKRTAQEIDGDFLSSGNTVFDLADIKSIEEMLTEYPPIKMRLGGQYREFNEPDPNTDYFIGADCATGRGTDYSSFTCMSKEGEEAVVYKGKIPLDKYAKLLGDTGEKFNYAKIAPESNDIGMAVVIKLQDEGYPNLYYSTKLLKKKGKSRPEEEKIPGWLTTQKNRSLIVEGLEKDIREDEVIIKDPFFVQEAYTFIYDGMGRPVAMGKHRQNNSDSRYRFGRSGLCR